MRGPKKAFISIHSTLHDATARHLYRICRHAGFGQRRQRGPIGCEREDHRFVFRRATISAVSNLTWVTSGKRAAASPPASLASHLLICVNGVHCPGEQGSLRWRRGPLHNLDQSPRFICVLRVVQFVPDYQAHDRSQWPHELIHN